MFYSTFLEKYGKLYLNYHHLYGYTIGNNESSGKSALLGGLTWALAIGTHNLWNKYPLVIKFTLRAMATMMPAEKNSSLWVCGLNWHKIYAKSSSVTQHYFNFSWFWLTYFLTSMLVTAWWAQIIAHLEFTVQFINLLLLLFHASYFLSV